MECVPEKNFFHGGQPPWKCEGNYEAKATDLSGMGETNVRNRKYVEKLDTYEFLQVFYQASSDTRRQSHLHFYDFYGLVSTHIPLESFRNILDLNGTVLKYPPVLEVLNLDSVMCVRWTKRTLSWKSRSRM